MTAHPLDNATWASLTGPHAALAQRHGLAVRYRPDISVFAALPGPADGHDEERLWADLAQLAGPGEVVGLTGPDRTPPAGWEVVLRGVGVQFDGSALQVRPDPEAVILGTADVPEMVDLAERTQPGPFRAGTHLMGRYLGIRRDGALVAMAGERVHPPGWSEISAVCTEPAYRGQGLAARLVRAVGAEIRGRGETPFLHTAADNTAALRLYHRLGFTVRRETMFAGMRTPGTAPGGAGAESRATRGPREVDA